MFERAFMKLAYMLQAYLISRGLENLLSKISKVFGCLLLIDYLSCV